MDYSHVSPAVYLLTEDRIIEFRRTREKDYMKPDPKECRGKLNGICLTYAFCGEQNCGIETLEKAFRVSPRDGLITRAPLEIVEKEGAKAIKYGKDVVLNDEIIYAAIQFGVVGYWDKANIIICAAPEYSFIIDSIKAFIKPRGAHFAFKRGYANQRNFVILAD